VFVVPPLSSVRGKDPAVALVVTWIVFGPVVIVSSVAVVVCGVANAPVAVAAAPFSVKVKLFAPLVTVTVALVEVGRLLTVRVCDSEVGALAVKAG
jgi:hypothetical protein